MSKREKLTQKLRDGNIDAKELRTLLKQCGFEFDGNGTSHEVWKREKDRYVLATHSKDLKRYQIKDAQEVLANDIAIKKTEGT